MGLLSSTRPNISQMSSTNLSLLSYSLQAVVIIVQSYETICHYFKWETQTGLQVSSYQHIL